jgi:hypothetical protein
MVKASLQLEEVEEAKGDPYTLCSSPPWDKEEESHQSRWSPVQGSTSDHWQEKN